jgi:hypothetical protein
MALNARSGIPAPSTVIEVSVYTVSLPKLSGDDPAYVDSPAARILREFSPTKTPADAAEPQMIPEMVIVFVLVPAGTTAVVKWDNAPPNPFVLKAIK